MISTLQELWGPEMMEALILSVRCSTGAGLTPNAWAHADCDASHRGCMGIGYSQETRLESVASIVKLRDERVTRKEQLLEECRLAEAKDNDGESEGDESKGESEWTYDKKGRKKFGPKEEYSIRGCVNFV